jgi:hypothetical protein
MRGTATAVTTENTENAENTENCNTFHHRGHRELPPPLPPQLQLQLQLLSTQSHRVHRELHNTTNCNTWGYNSRLLVRRVTPLPAAREVNIKSVAVADAVLGGLCVEGGSRSPPSVALWLCGSVALWLCGSVALWLCGSVALWLCGSVALWLCGSVVRGLTESAGQAEGRQRTCAASPGTFLRASRSLTSPPPSASPSHPATR